MSWIKDKDKKVQLIKYLVYAIILIGVALRLCILFQNRNLFLDECDVARNIYERNWLQLTQPLSYYQFAPPLFLWGLKFFTTVFGYGEYAFKIIPLLSGIGGLFVFHRILLRYEVKNMTWYPLFLLATGYLYIRYASEVKQYSSDSFIALCLIYLALRIDILSVRPIRFLAIWIGAGSLALWGSMPSVFVLAGVGLYYLAVAWQAQQRSAIYLILATGVLWGIEFLCYYEAILRPQIASEYLQNFHKPDFLFLIPHSMEELQHNWSVTLGVLGVAGGHWALSLVFHIAMMIIALVYAVRRRVVSVLLLVTPMGLLLLAASLHQFTLLPRVILFILPVILILIAIGFEQAVKLKYVNVAFVAVSFVALFNFAQFKYLYEPLYIQQVTESLTFIKGKKIDGAHLYVHAAAVPQYEYYTTIHPRRAEWQSLWSASCLRYGVPYDSVGAVMRGTTALLYAYEHPEDMAVQQAQLNRYMIKTDHFSSTCTEAFIYSQRQ